MSGNPSHSRGASCDMFRRYRLVHSSSLPRLRQPKAASSSSPTRPTAMASTNALPKATSAAPPPRALTANHAILHWPRPTGASTPMKSPARFPRRLRDATMAGAANMLPLPASADRLPRQDCGAVRPYRRPGNDVTLPREARMGGRVGCGCRLSIACAEIVPMAGYA